MTHAIAAVSVTGFTTGPRAYREYLAGVRLPVLLTRPPLIYLCVIPFILLDVSVMQSIRRSVFRYPVSPKCAGVTT